MGTPAEPQGGEKAGVNEAPSDLPTTTNTVSSRTASVSGDVAEPASASADGKKGEQTAPGAEPDADIEYPTGLKLTLIILSLCLAIFLVALDQTIIAPALGAITAEFHSVKDIVSLPFLSGPGASWGSCC